MVTTTLLKAEDLYSLPDSLRPWELWRGALRELMPTGGPHGAVDMRLAGALAPHVYALNLGALFSEGTAFVLERDPDTVFCPDLAFVAKGRLPAGGLRAGFLELAPDLAVEILSPSDRPGELGVKIAEYLRLGVRAVWLIDPRRRTVRIYASDGGDVLLTESEELDGGEVIPGFRCPVAALFADLHR